jgi:hypothetical protein
MGKRNKLAKISFGKLQKKAMKKKEAQKLEKLEKDFSDEEDNNNEKKQEQPKSMRHRRVKNNKEVLSRGQKRRLDKKQKFVRRNDLVEKIKLNQSMINTTMNKTIIEEPKKNDKFNLGDINSDILNLLSDISKEKKTVPEIRAKKKKGRQVM